MSTRLRNTEQNLPALNKQLQEVETLRSEMKRVKALLANQATKLSTLERTREFTGVNNIAFTWTGTTLTLSWTAGSTQDREGNYVPVPAGSKVLVADTYYWIAWNPVHRVLAFQTDLSLLNSNPNNLIISRIHTGNAGDTGIAGGGGAEPSVYGGWDNNRSFYNYFP